MDAGVGVGVGVGVDGAWMRYLGSHSERAHRQRLCRSVSYGQQRRPAGHWSPPTGGVGRHAMLFGAELPSLIEPKPVQSLCPGAIGLVQDEAYWILCHWTWLQVLSRHFPSLPQYWAAGRLRLAVR